MSESSRLEIYEAALRSIAEYVNLSAGREAQQALDMGRNVDASPLTFARIIEMSNSRGARWLAGTEWTAADYAMAASGEAGELAGAVIDLIEIEIKTLIIQYRVGEMSNAVKKLRRIENEMQNFNEPGRQLATREEAIHKVGQEMADTILYMPQLAKKLGIDLEARVKETFNEKSEQYGFPERL